MSLRLDLERLTNHPWSNNMVAFRPLKTEEDLIYVTYGCQLFEAQKELVNPAWFSIGRAYLSPDDNFPCVIDNEHNVPIGFINLCKWLGNGEAYTWSYFIDNHHQGKVYGRKSAQLAVELLKSANPDKCIKLAVEKLI